MPVTTYREALRAAMAEEMERDESVVLLGEDIGVYGGTHLITDGLLDRFGPKRVLDTPIAEGGFTGAAIGMAMGGMKPIVEMMTWNFSFQAADQIIQNAAKLHYFSGGQVNVPLVIRGPNGGGVQLSAQHTHSLEGFYGHFPGLKVVSPATPHDVKGMMLTAIRDPNPVIFLEAGALYGTKGEVPEGEFTVQFGKARVAREGNDITLIAYGRQVNLLLKVADRLANEEKIQAEVIDLRSIRPFDEDTIVNSVRRPTARSSSRSSGAGSASPARSPRSSRNRPSTISTRRSGASAARKSRPPTRAISNSPCSRAKTMSSTAVHRVTLPRGVTMATVIMPKMGDGMEEGTLLRWLKNVGEEVDAGDPIAEIETDKVTLEIEAAEGGVLTQTLGRRRSNRADRDRDRDHRRRGRRPGRSSLRPRRPPRPHRRRPRNRRRRKRAEAGNGCRAARAGPARGGTGRGNGAAGLPMRPRSPARRVSGCAPHRW